MWSSGNRHDPRSRQSAPPAPAAGPRRRPGGESSARPGEDTARPSEDTALPRNGRAPQYKRYRARRRLREGNDGGTGTLVGAPPPRRGGGGGRGPRLTRGRAILGALALVAGWLLLSLVLFLVSAQFERSSPPGDVQGVLDPAGWPLTNANNILVLGSDRRPEDSGTGGVHSARAAFRLVVLIRTGGGSGAAVEIPRDTVVEIPGHGLQKINAAYAFGGPALSISMIKRYLGVPINHVVEVNFENFPQLIDAMGGVDYTGGCITSRLDGGSSRGGYTLRLPAGTHHLNGKQALALARSARTCARPPRPTWTAPSTSRRSFRT